MAETSEPQTDIFDPEDPKYYINRELSLLEFFRRVLEEAQDERNPLLERVKFLSIVFSNLDEFFMVRVASLTQQDVSGVMDTPPDGLTPSEQLAAIRKVALKLMLDARDCFTKDLLSKLDKAGIHILEYNALRDDQKTDMKHYFDEVVYPVLTPLAFDPARPFPYISNLSLNIAIIIRDKKGHEHFVRVKVPNSLPRFVPLKRPAGRSRKDRDANQFYFCWLEQVVAANLTALFPGMEILESFPFHVTRNADMIIQELEAEDLLEVMEQSVRQRRFGSVVRLLINPAMPDDLRQILIEKLEINSNDVYTLDGPLGLSSLSGLTQLERKDLKDPSAHPAVPNILKNKNKNGEMFDVFRREDVLLHHPYDSFIPVVDFLRCAANDPDVLAIKQTIYRVDHNSPVVDALLEAAQNDKQVAALVELKARFDEESNIDWAKTLEAEGVHVVYGLLGLKTHSKVALVVRKEGDKIRRYVHLATGNYNTVTAQLYTDLGLFTTDEAIGADATDLFNYLTGYSAKQDYRKLLVAPINLRERLTALIRREIEHQKKGAKGHLIFKVNSLVDAPMIRLLYEASRAGVQCDLLVRGICCLRPGIPGVSENIRVISIVGRFLEHSRIYYFSNGGKEEVLLGSADLMPRNIDRRVEVLFPVEKPRLIRYLRDDVLNIYLADNTHARRLLPTGAYERITPGPNETPMNSQTWLLDRHQRSRRGK